MNTMIEQMLSKYKLTTINDKKNAIKEIMQEIVLCGLSRSGFFEKAVFYGGTALRIFYGLNRFSENLDFSLKTTDETFDLNKYLPVLEKEIKAMGLNLKVEEKNKSKDSNIKSAFLKGGTKEHLLMFYSDSELVKGINPEEMIKIKFEVDTNPPDFANFEYQYRLLPMPYEVGLYDMSSLFAGKIHAVVCRAWQSRIKGRDLYDYIFYLQNNTSVNLKHLKARFVQSGFETQGEELTIAELKDILIKKFEQIDYNDAKKDVKTFIKDESQLDIWSKEFFISITKSLLK